MAKNLGKLEHPEVEAEISWIQTNVDYSKLTNN